MPRQPRLDAPGASDYVTGRTIDGVKLFRNRKDREDFPKRVTDPCQADALRPYAWVLMENQFHLLVRKGNQLLSRSMRKLLEGWVVNFDRRHGG